MPTRRPLLSLALLAALAPAARAAVRMTDWPTGCRVLTDHYQLSVDVTLRPTVELRTADGQTHLANLGEVSVSQAGRTFWATAQPPPHFHPLRSGPYLVELHLENIILRDAAGDWPGLGELSLFCHEDRVYVLAAFLCPQKEWINRGLYVYHAPPGRAPCPPVSPTAFRIEFTHLPAAPGLVAQGVTALGAVVAGGPALALRGTLPAGQPVPSPVLGSGPAAEAFTCRPADLPWPPGSVHEVGGMIAVAPTTAAAEAALAEEGHPLPATAFTMQMGQCAGYDPARGVYALTAVTSGTPEPPRSLRAGTRFRVRNDGPARTILVDQRDPWGGISGGIIRDGAGLPLPIIIQFGLNFPELNAEAGEPGWATLTYPLALAPGQVREVRGEHLYHALADREVLYLTSLEDIGDPLLLQVTVGRGESHTLTTGPYPGPLTPGNELRINDFRRIYSQLRVRSVSAILPTFFGYWDAAGKYQGLMPGPVTFRETSPFAAEYSLPAATGDGAVSGSLRVWQAPQDDMTRVFTEVSLRVNRTVRLDHAHPAPLFFLRHHAFNPMAFMRYAYTGPDGATRAGALTYARTVVANGAPLGELPFGCIYHADNALDNGVPCSDITGNPGFVLLDWDVRLGDKPVRPGCYLFCTGAGDVPDGDYARDLAVVPTERLEVLPEGSVIRYRAVQMVWGDNSSGPADMERERARWALKPLRVSARVGEALSADPPEFRAVGGRADVEISGGAGWLPVRVRGMAPGRPLEVRQTDASGARDLGPGAPDEPWYSAWPEAAERSSDARPSCGFTFLVKMPETGGPIRLEIR